jgi:phosphate transport system ATP-binding protein
MPVYENKVTALIGPVGLRQEHLPALLQPHARPVPGPPLRRRDRAAARRREHAGDRDVDPIEVRMRISMVFQKPNPFPKSIFENVAYGLRVRGERRAATSRTRSRPR